jgi:predicted CoA-substrate-specific enzyme activase
MPEGKRRVGVGVDVGTECVKTVVLREGDAVLGRAVVPTRGYFEACVKEVLAAALDDAQLREDEVDAVCATGFGMRCVKAHLSASESACHAEGAYHHLQQAMTVVNIGGRDPRVIRVDAAGRSVESRPVRRCAVGIGTFLIFTARHLDIHPTRLHELAAAAAGPAPISSFCSVFSQTEILERLREGASIEEVALGSMRSIAERIVEAGPFEPPVVVTGGVAEYFPGVLKGIEEMSGVAVSVAPDPIFAGALGAALKALAAR